VVIELERKLVGKGRGFRDSRTGYIQNSICRNEESQFKNSGTHVRKEGIILNTEEKQTDKLIESESGEIIDKLKIKCMK
jgi:hypothetical protein